MKSKAGFLLSSYIVYVTLLIMIMATTIRLSVIIIPQAYCLIEWNTHTDFYGACDHLYKGFCNAPIQADQWYKADKEGFIWHIGSKDYGWLVRDNKLIYKEGMYDKVANKWISATTSLIAPDVYFEHVDLFVKDGRVQEVSCVAYKCNQSQHIWSSGRVFEYGAH
jgi:hypothetical protein